MMKWVLFVLMSFVVVFNFAAPDVDAKLGWGNPELARILFFHVPTALGTIVFGLIGAWFSIQYLRNSRTIDDIKAKNLNVIAYAMALLAIVTGMIFSDVQWGKYWSWDPRQTSFLAVIFILSAYFAVRAAIADQEKQALIGAIYNVASMPVVLFFTFVYPRLPAILAQSLHPSTTIQNGSLDGPYRLGLYGTFLCIVWFAAWLYKLKVRADVVQYELELLHAELDHRRSDSAPRVVRAVPLHE